MSDVDTIGLLAAGSGAALVGRTLWDRFVRRAEVDERKLEQFHEAKEERTDARLEAFAAGLGEIKGQLGVLLERLAFNAAEFRRLDERQAGMSANHGARIAQLEAEVVRLKVLIEALAPGAPKGSP